MYPNDTGVRKPWEYESARETGAVASFFNVVYAWMAVALAVTAAVAWFCSQSPVMLRTVYGSKGGYLVFGLGAFAIAWVGQSMAGRMSAVLSTVLLLVYAALIGMLISAIFLVYKQATLVSAFLLTGGTFATMSIFGFVTKRDLSRMGSILIMCFWGLLLASVVNIFVASGPLSWVITYGIVIVFVGITAYYTQQLKQIALSVGDDPVLAPRMAMYGALILYISFINLFLAILRILGRGEE